MRHFKTKAVEQLVEQLIRYTPVDRCLEHLNRAERFLAEIVPGRRYPYEYIEFRVTGFRPTTASDDVLEGADLEHDLSLLISELAKKAPPVPVEEFSEPVVTLDELSRKLKVSTKTLNRWRDEGLVIRRVIRNGKRRIGVRQSLLQRFLERNEARVDRGGRFTLLTDDERGKILVRAKRLARVAPESFTEICRRIAKKFGRSVETVRSTIIRHDQERPAEAIFPGWSGPLDEKAKQAIYSSHRRGISIDALAKRFNRARTSVYRVINEVRAHRIKMLPLDYIDHPSFRDPKAVNEIMAPMPALAEYEAARAKARASAPKGLPPELASLYEVPLLNREQEAHLFRQMNYLKFKASRLRDRIDPSRARTGDLDRLEELNRKILEIKDQLISANMRLVASIAKKHTGPEDNYFELMSDGNVSLMRAVEKFDFSRGNKFSTYASWAIMKNFARSIPDEKHRRDRFVTGLEEMFETKADSRSDEHDQLASAERAHRQVNRLLDRLDERERRIIQLRAGLDAERGLTLEQVGKALGITKERVRQLEARTMSKLRSLAREERVELP